MQNKRHIDNYEEKNKGGEDQVIVKQRKAMRC